MAININAQTVKLPAPDKNVKMTLMQALQQRKSSREFAAKAVSNATMSQLLWAACGINRPKEKKITAPSALNKQDIMVYVIRKDGAYIYQPTTNSLKKVCAGDLRPMVAGGQAFAKSAPVCLLLVSDLNKFSGNRSGAEATANVDAGYVSQNICLACTALGLKTVPRMTMNKAALKKALKLDDNKLLIINHPVGY